MKSQKLVFSILIFLFLADILAFGIVFELAKPKFLEVNFFNVGQGDAIFIETPKSQRILIDGGPSSALLEKLAKEMPFWDRTIDLVILTHPEKDHLAGLIEALKRYRVENILWTGVIRETSEFQEWLKLIKQENAKIYIAEYGQKIELQRSQNCDLQGPDFCNFMVVFNPLESLDGQEFRSSNNTSIVVKLVFGKNSFLFAGDAGKEIEKELIERGEDLDSDVLKVGHHGSKTASSDEFVERASPQIAVISVGKLNSYGQPHQEVLKILAKYGIKTLKTDLDGDIKIVSDGKNLKIK